MSSGFITEKEVEEQKKIRQEEWERVRKPEEPKEAPEPVPCNKSLFEQLQEQKFKKQEEFEESHKLKNLVKCLDGDEVEFLEYVDRTKLEEERKKRLEEAKEIDEFRSAVTRLREEEKEKYRLTEIGLAPEPKSNNKTQPDNSISIGSSKKLSQNKLLSGVVKRKSVNSSNAQEEPENKIAKAESEKEEKNLESGDKKASPEKEKVIKKIETVPYKGNLRIVGVLPGLSSYATNSSDDGESDECCDSSDSDHNCGDRPFFDLCGRKIQQKDEKE